MTTGRMKVWNFSGGRTSAYMTIHGYEGGDLVLFCDTGREHPKTYKFINDFEAFENIPVIRLQYPGGFENMLSKEHVIPNRWKRKCTIQLKVKTARRYLISIGIRDYDNMIGFRADEPYRVHKHAEHWKTVDTKFPLYKQGITKQMINEYWQAKPYQLEIPAILGNCDLCFMKGQNAIMAIMSKYPELADKWIADEDNSKLRKEGKKEIGHTYFEGITMKQLRDNAQNTLFKDYDLNILEPEINCACTS